MMAAITRWRRVQQPEPAGDPVVDHVFIDITDATVTGQARAAADLAILARSVREHPGEAASYRHQAFHGVPAEER